MRKDPANWEFGVVYYCQDDLRIVVRNLLPFGWAWNFGHRKAYIKLLIAIVAFLPTPVLAWQMDVGSALSLGVTVAATLVALVFVASRLAQDPGA